MNDQYNYPPAYPVRSSGVAVAALICGIVAFLCNPLYVISLAAIILGIVGLCQTNISNKGMAIAGLALGGTSLVLQFVLDLILSIFTMGMSFFI